MSNQLRHALYGSVTESDIANIMAKQIEKAKEGDPKATKVVLDYLLGGPTQKMRVERVSVNTRMPSPQETTRPFDEDKRAIELTQVIEPQAVRVQRLLALVMDKAPGLPTLKTLSEGELDQAERWVAEQSAALRAAASGKKVTFPAIPSFLS